MNTPPDVKVGDGCTLHLLSDSHAATIVAVSKNRHQIKVQQDTAMRVDANGQSEDQRYAYRPNPSAVVLNYRWARRQTYINRKNAIRRCVVGYRREYYDPGF